MQQAVGDVPSCKQFQLSMCERASCAHNLQSRVEVEYWAYGREPWQEVLVALALSHIKDITVKELVACCYNRTISVMHDADL